MRRLLIANRGEIVARIARTAHRLGIETVGVYSEPDAAALHVDAVDVAVALGGVSATESYLRGDRVIEAALDTGCDSLHPGYGFLSENAPFARSVIGAGLTWVGPTPEQMEILGDKVKAKRAAVAAGVPCAPIVEVTPGVDLDSLTYPVLVKAAAGGGGRGMRVVTAPEQLEAALESAAREAQASFGDGTVFIEPYIEAARHIEVQIAGDGAGHVVHLGERDCSIQRRNQKVLEEAPAPGLRPEIREALLAGAISLGRYVDYRGVGTVEFLVGDTGLINFLEVNTRLQVEHPVTEAVTGVDLVELQLRVASGQGLGIQQSDLHVDGHAIEARLVAERPNKGWLPSTGRLTSFNVPESVRTDAGVRAGSTVTPHYDSLLAKVISHAASRTQAAGQLRRALRASSISGCRTNIDALVAILGETDFLAGRTSTDYLRRHPDVESAGALGAEELAAHVLAAALMLESHDRAADRQWGFAPSGWRNVRTIGQRQTWLDVLLEERLAIELHVTEPGVGRATVEGSAPGAPQMPSGRGVGLRWRIDRQSVAIEVDGVTRSIAVEQAADRFRTRGPGGRGEFRLLSPFPEGRRGGVGSGTRAPLPGVVVAVHAKPGDRVVKGQVLLVLESMKMENPIKAAVPGVVGTVQVVVGDRVDAGATLVTMAEN